MAQTLEQQIKTLAETAHAVLIISPDLIRRERASFSLATHFLGIKELTSESLEKVNADEWNSKNFKSFSDSLQNISLFSAKRCIQIKNIEKVNASISELFLKSLKQDLTDTLLIVSSEKILKTSKIYKEFSAKDSIIDLPALQPAQALKWIQREFNQAGIKNVSSELLNLIQTQSAGSLDEAASMIERLTLYAIDDTLTENDFFALFRDIPNPKEFDLLDAIQQRRFLDAEVLLQQLLNASKNKFLLLSMLFKPYFQALQIKLMLAQGLSTLDIQNKLAFKSQWLFNKNLSLARSYSIPQLRKKIALIATTDSKLKNLSLSDDCVLGELVQRLAK